METKYSYVISTGTKNGTLASDALTKEIEQSTIVTALSRIDSNAGQVEIWFKEAISANDQTTLTLIVNNHEGVPITKEPETVVIREEEEGKTQGHYQACAHQIIIDQAKDEWKDLDITFPYPISIFSASFALRDYHEGDEVEVLVAPDTTIGAVTADVAASATVLDVQDSVLENTQIGYEVNIFDGTNDDPLGRVLAIDKINKQITVETATVNAFLSATPSFIKQNIFFIKRVILPGAYVTTIGDDIIGGSLLPANTVLRIRYKNVEGTAVGKTFAFLMEYKY